MLSTGLVLVAGMVRLVVCQVTEPTPAKGQQDPPRAVIPLVPVPVDVPISAPGVAPGSDPAPTVPVLKPSPDSSPPAFAGRGVQRELGEKYGGTEEAAAAVDAALEWLARHQLRSGQWSLDGTDTLGKARYSRGAQRENREAATALALLAFSGAGHTHKAGKYGRQIDMGIRALLKSQDTAGNFYQQKQGTDEWMYTQALSTRALCDLYTLTADVKLREPCRKAVEFCLYAQGREGGWRYRPQSEGDTSVTGWMVLALASAKNAKFTVPQEALDRVGKYLDLAAAGPGGLAVRAPGGRPAGRHLAGSRYAYMPGEDVDNPVMTAEGLLCRMHLGWKQDDPRLNEGVRFLIDQHLPEWRTRDVYYWYHASHAMFHFGGDDWKVWNDQLRDVLVEKQEKIGAEKGSWDPLTPGWPAERDGADTWSMNQAGGRLYVTCLTTYVLQIYGKQPLYAVRDEKNEE
jgi:hypothetical protein